MTQLDHLVIGASTLAAGVAYVRDTLGVEIPQGGEHPLMGTHNHLMRLGTDLFLEVITSNPNAPTPKRPRWYGLDDPFVQAQIAQQPKLLTWVVNTPDIIALQKHSSFSFGNPTPVSRGDLTWHFGIPDDGRLLAGGLLPYMIQWHTTAHPAQHMADRGCTLHKLTLNTPHHTWIETVLGEIGALDLVELNQIKDSAGRVVGSPHITAEIMTPTGLKTLS